jgi:sugar phosphate isomerase/epimerase
MTARHVSLNQFPLEHLPVEQVFAEAADAGFEGIGLSMTPTRLLGPDKVGDLLAEHGLKATSLCVAVDRIDDQGSDPIDDCALRLLEAAHTAGQLAVPLVVMVGHATGSGPRALADLGTLLGRLGGRSPSPLLVEPLTPVLAELTAITSLRSLHTLLDQAPGIGWILDVWHSWCDPDLADLLPVLAPRCSVVHLSDYRFLPESPLSRVQPGAGLIDIPETIRALDRAGFAGWFESEVLTPQPVTIGGLPTFVRSCRDSISAVLPEI